jgi:hypothetical protein
VGAIQTQLLQWLEQAEGIVSIARSAAFTLAGVTRPAAMPATDSRQRYQRDTESQRALSELIRRSRLSLLATIHLWRSQTAHATRPNKALCPDHINWLLAGYEQQDLGISIMQHGVQHEFSKQQSEAFGLYGQSKNHKSAVVLENALLRSIREGQDIGTYLVFDDDVLAMWPEVRVSPFGCVPKGDIDPGLQARVIHDLSFPSGESVNDASDPTDLPALSYEHVGALARRIETLKACTPSAVVKIKRGDVNAAFCNVFGHSSVCAKFGGRLRRQGAVVLALALPVGWTGSPAHYGAFGGAITFLVRRESPATLVRGHEDHDPFFCYTWVDDHVLVEEDRGHRLKLCEVTLRLSMLAILGPKSINEKKFTDWTTSARALGLDWDTERRTLSVPPDKITKALGRVQELLRAHRASRTGLSCLLGLRRHVCSCIRSARPFFRRLAALHRRAPLWGTLQLSQGGVLDLLWFEHILRYGRLEGIPFGSLRHSQSRLSIFTWTPAMRDSQLFTLLERRSYVFGSTAKSGP